MKQNSWLRLSFINGLLLAGLFFTITSCDEDDTAKTRTFHVTIQNVSSTTTLQSGAMPDRTAPVSPGVWAVLESDHTIFDLSEESSLAIERQAEEGSPTLLAGQLALDDDVDESGEFSSPGGPDNGPAIASGETTSFSFDADPGERLQILTMFGQSNDWFYAFGDGGLDLFNGNTAISGDQTSKLVLYDAGTELDEMPGLGVTQKPDHPTTVDIGPLDPLDMITLAMSRHTTFIIPPTNGVLKVTITSEE